MPPSLAFLLLAAAFMTPAAAKQPGCEEFAKNTSFTSSQAVGTWHMLHIRSHPIDSLDAYCVEFLPVTDQERKNLTSRIGKFANLKWERLVLKMEIPCRGPTGHNDKTRDYYLEKLDVDGSYMTLFMPPPDKNITKKEYAAFERDPMRLKLVENKYLAMMDCKEHFMFLFDKQPHETKLEPALRILLQAYLPEEN